MEIKKIEFYDYDKAIEYTWKYEKPKYVSNMEKEKIFYENFSKYNLLDGTITYYGAFENDKIIGIIGYHQNKILFIYSDDLIIQNELLISILNELKQEYYYEILLSKKIKSKKINQTLEKTKNKEYPLKYIIRT